MELIAVAAQGNVLEVKRLAALGADVNVQNVDGRSPLHSTRFVTRVHGRPAILLILVVSRVLGAEPWATPWHPVHASTRPDYAGGGGEVGAWLSGVPLTQMLRAAPRQITGARLDRTSSAHDRCVLNTRTDGVGSSDSLAEASPPSKYNVPSSGVDALFMALQMCEQVHIYGFSVDAPRDAPSHYFKEEKLYGIDITTQAWGHDYQMQANFLKVLHVAGFLTICCPAHPEDAPGECFQ